MVSEVDPKNEISSPEAKAVIEKAREDVKSLLKSTDDEIAAKIEAAREAGQKKGYEKAQELKDKLAKLQTLILDEVQEGVMHAAFSVAESVLKNMITSTPETVLPIVQNALSEIPDSSQIWLRVNPADAPLLIKNKQKIIDAMERIKEIDIREDRQVERGGVLIQTESGVIDAQIKTQVEEMARLLGV